MRATAGLELEVKRGTAKIAVEGLVKRRAPQHFQQVWKGTTANLLLQGGAPRHLQFEEILSIDLKRLVVLVIIEVGDDSGMADYSWRAHDSKGKGHHGTGMQSMRQKIGGHDGKWKGHDGNHRRCRRVIRGLQQHRSGTLEAMLINLCPDSIARWEWHDKSRGW